MRTVGAVGADRRRRVVAALSISSVVVLAAVHPGPVLAEEPTVSGFAFFYDTLGNVAWGHIIRTYLGILPDEFVVWCQEHCREAGSTSAGDITMVRAGLTLTATATFGDYVRTIRSTAPALKARADPSLNYRRAPSNKIMDWSRV